MSPILLQFLHYASSFSNYFAFLLLDVHAISSSISFLFKKENSKILLVFAPSLDTIDKRLSINLQPSSHYVTFAHASNRRHFSREYRLSNVFILFILCFCFSCKEIHLSAYLFIYLLKLSANAKARVRCTLGGDENEWFCFETKRRDEREEKEN